MTPPTALEIKRYAPGAKDIYVEALTTRWSDLQRAGLDDHRSLCVFLAQTAHETGGYTILTERTAWTAEQMCALWPGRFKTKVDPRILACGRDAARLGELAYGGRRDLGNDEKGDGYRYRGRGFFQDTGRACYREYGRLIGVDLEGSPELLEKPEISLKVALARWKKMDLGRLAKRGYNRAVGNAINRGSPYSSQDPIGGKSRQDWYERAWALFGDGSPPPPDLALGAYGEPVLGAQMRLKELGYAVGSADKVFGPTMARAVAAFKLDHKRKGGGDIEADEIVGPLTLRALDAGATIEVSADRAGATARDLAAAGSTEVQAGQQQKAAGWLMLAGGTAEGARQAGLLDMLQSGAGWLPATHTFMVPVVDAIKWAFQNAFWAVAVVGGVWFWTKGRQVIMARLEAHRLGRNLWR